MGAQNWTKNFRAEFTKRRGYDPKPFYPAYSGVIIESREVTERFLWDLRLTSQDLIKENHVQFVKKYGEPYGLNVSIEPYDMNPAGDLETASVADLPMAEFWSVGRGFDSSWSVIEAASIAHLIGQPVVGAESFTAHGDGWRQHPASVKNQGDWAFAAGITRFIYHTYQHQPLPDTLRPGMAMGPYGVHWDRNQTWWPYAGAYHRYVARCQYLLQQGRTVADILYLAPESAPYVFRAPKSAYSGESHMPDRKGYSFDACPPSLLLNAFVKDGKVTFPSGATYSLLALPAFDTMTPELLKKIISLVNDGATIIGLPPTQSPSLEGYPECDKEVRALAKTLWGEGEIPINLKTTTYGKGRVVFGQELKSRADNLFPHYDVTADILSKATPPDFETTGEIRYTHRTLPGTDLYFVANRSAVESAAECAFRVTGRQPELWDPVTGKISVLPEYKEENGRTIVPLQFDIHESYFIVFRDKNKTGGAADPTKSAGRGNFSAITPLFVLDGPWDVSFDPKWGGPEKVVFDTLSDWSKNDDKGIKYYSGTAVYKKRFDVPEAAGKKLLLDLGEVKNIAHVRLNGKDLGTIWTYPWRVEITGNWKSKDNLLEIEVTNLWANRLIGDEHLPPDSNVNGGTWIKWLESGAPRTSGRFTFSTARHFRKESALLRSGLIGPVRVLTEEK
jgi:hypothetical protein